jgi:predicted amidophosphoribosyltransferase
MITEIPRGFKLVCERCGGEFNTYYWDDGAIEHMNKTNSHNLSSIKKRGDLKKYIDELKERDRKCVLIWLGV